METLNPPIQHLGIIVTDWRVKTNQYPIIPVGIKPFGDDPVRRFRGHAWPSSREQTVCDIADLLAAALIESTDHLQAQLRQTRD